MLLVIDYVVLLQVFEYSEVDNFSVTLLNKENFYIRQLEGRDLGDFFGIGCIWYVFHHQQMLHCFEFGTQKVFQNQRDLEHTSWLVFG